VISPWRLRTDLLHTPVRAPREPLGMIRAPESGYVRSRPDLTMILTVMFFAGTFSASTLPVTLALMATHAYHKRAWASSGRWVR